MKQNIQKNFDFFDKLSAILQIDLDRPLKQISSICYNTKASPLAKIVNVELEFLDDLTEDDWNRIVVQSPKLRIISVANIGVDHKAPNGKFFTIQDIKQAIEKTELQTRGQSEWLGGIDAHHVFFEGVSIHNGVWHLHWGS